MKAKFFLLIAILSGSAIVFLSMDKLRSDNGPHGGRVKPAGDFNIESKIESPYFYAYLLNKQNDSVSNKGISCEISFYFPDSTTLEFPLKPYETDGFTLESTVSDYTSYRLTFYAFGKNVSARFENENAIVKKKE